MFCQFSLAYFLLIEDIQASTFKPHCTLPPSGTNYVSGPNTRGTLTILWNCLSIIVLCTWSIQRLNVPAIRAPEEHTVKEMWQTVLDLRKKIKWMAFTVLFPEYLVGRAFGERLGMKVSVDDMLEYNASWENVHAYMANMGHFVLDTEGDLGIRDSLTKSDRINSARLQYRYWALTASQLWRAIQLGIIDPPEVSASHLKKLDNGEAFIKALALIQVSYLIIQLVVRKVAHLPSTQLEIETLAYSASSILTYLLSWNRPQGIETVHLIPVKQNARDRKFVVETLAKDGPMYLWLDHRPEDTFDENLGPAPIPNDATYFGAELNLPESVYKALAWNSEIATLAFGVIVGGTLFGGLHCLAWDFSFPTHWEALTWRISSIMISALPPLSIVPVSFWIRSNPWNLQRERKVSPTTRIILKLVLLMVFIVPYFLARLFLIVEIFRSLFFLPPEAFIDTWSGSFPHWG
ncbi:hypothetical protein NA56DRAFT_582915 [Hyaloscypha hepaticicola]|uniref:Uncharacterized protein n=1 Tax=Hyaloscypha hepaticicola TaxID=2082293 RepID=A0A2J6PLH3_9HELO|nr:hypothetical protein NA56DRAFT_582915 [Hyaloscypha hepaticicola]